MYPEGEFGKEFWQRVYKQASQKFESSETSTNILNKIWVVPEKAVIYVNGRDIFVADSHLKVMLEADYLAMEHHDKGLDDKADNSDLTEESETLFKEILLPEIEREINEGKNFANLRQIYHSVILATWYKHHLKDSLLGQGYADKNKVNGIALEAIPFRAMRLQVVKVDNHAPSGMLWLLRPYAESSDLDPIQRRRRRWAETEERIRPRLGFPPYHATAFYLLEPLSEQELTDLRALRDQYNKTPWDDVDVTALQVIAYNDPTFNSGTKVLATIAPNLGGIDLNAKNLRNVMSEVRGEREAFVYSLTPQVIKPEQIDDIIPVITNIIYESDFP